MLPHRDAPGSATTVLFDDTRRPNGDQVGQHLAVTYNALRQEVKLYVDGQLAFTAVGQRVAAWAATGGLQLGRSMSEGSFGEYLSGVVDDVRVYKGVADASVVQLMVLPSAGPDL